MSRISIVPTGTANIASVKAAFRRLGLEPVEVVDGEDVALADRVVLPGVGTFGAAVKAVERGEVDQALRSRIEEGRPTLAICVGMQLLAETSEESDGIEGLGIVHEPVTRFPGSLRVPQLGWNQVEPDSLSRLVKPGWAYFANSFRIERPPAGWVTSGTDYGGRFTSAMERGDVLALQFHPELSGKWGASVLQSWIDATARRAA
jgi:imidazole glycerol phosphate synthase glutamine amidotransferase subunit